MSGIAAVAPLVLTQPAPPRAPVDGNNKFYTDHRDPEGRLRSRQEVSSGHPQRRGKKCGASPGEATAATRNESAGPRAPGQGIDLPRGLTELCVSVSRSLQPNPTPTPGSVLPLVGAGPAASSGGRGPSLAHGALPARDPRRGTVTSNGEGSGLKLPSVQPTASSLLSGPAQGPAREGSATVDRG